VPLQPGAAAFTAAVPLIAPAQNTESA